MGENLAEHASLLSINQEENLYSRENYFFHRASSKMLKNQRLVFLKNATAVDFYNMTAKHKELQRALRNHFIGNLTGLSNQQARAEQTALEGDLVKLFEKRNSSLRKYASEVGEAAVLFGLAGLAVLQDSVAPSAAVPGAVAIGGIITRLWIALRKWRDKPEHNVIVPAFEEIKSSEELEHTTPRSPSRVSPTVKPVEPPNPDIEEMQYVYMQFSWTEERHNYLKSLPLVLQREFTLTD